LPDDKRNMNATHIDASDPSVCSEVNECDQRDYEHIYNEAVSQFLQTVGNNEQAQQLALEFVAALKKGDRIEPVLNDVLKERISRRRPNSTH
jgi:hypothetical protein